MKNQWRWANKTVHGIPALTSKINMSLPNERAEYEDTAFGRHGCCWEFDANRLSVLIYSEYRKLIVNKLSKLGIATINLEGVVPGDEVIVKVDKKYAKDIEKLLRINRHSFMQLYENMP